MMLYYFDYNEKEGGMSPLLLHMHMFAIADRYFVEPLQTLAVEKFNRRAYEDWSSAGFAETLLTLYSLELEAGKVETLKLIVLEVVKEHAKSSSTTRLMQRSKKPPSHLLASYSTTRKASPQSNQLALTSCVQSATTGTSVLVGSA